jgi:iron complex outermembrane receptor protein
MSVDELMNIQVTSVSKRLEKLSETASAIQVITGEDIRRSGVTTLPEALRLASNLQVAQSNAHDWAITARGFSAAPLSNNTLADKLLVMIDGRTVYTPLFGGVFWDAQNVLLEDIDRIEVISGPGGTLWGANAVNGVINIVTKSAKETQGLYVTVAGGSLLQDLRAIRYGGTLGSRLSYRVYGQRIDHGSSIRLNGNDAKDSWNMTEGGVRTEYVASDVDTMTLQGDAYGGHEGVPNSTNYNGQNVLGRWKRTFSEQSDMSLQMYFDRTWRILPVSKFRDELRTYDADFQHRFPIGTRQSILWGTGYRFMQDGVNNAVALSFFPTRMNMRLVSGFVQDEIILAPDLLKLTLGTKLEHNDFSGFELQPSARMAWTPSKQHTVWTAVSRAIRSPSRIDVDASTPSLIGDSTFEAEKVTTYELGYRVEPTDVISLSLAGFYNLYRDLRSINFNPNPPPTLVIANGQRGVSRGIEFSGTFRATDWWSLRGGYTTLHEYLRNTMSGVVPGSDVFEADDPNNQSMLQSKMDLPGHLQLDLIARHVGALPPTFVRSYSTADVRLAWQHDDLTFSLVGQNLGARLHPEFIPLNMPRSVYGQITLRR